MSLTHLQYEPKNLVSPAACGRYVDKKTVAGDGANGLRTIFLLCIAAALFSPSFVSATEEPTPPLLPEEAIKQGTLIEPTSGPIVVLADGGLLVAQPGGLTLADPADPDSTRRLKLDSAIFGPVEIPTSYIAGILFHPPTGTQERDKAIAEIPCQTGDLVLLTNGDQLAGPLLDITNRQVTLDTAFGQTDIKTDRVASIVFAPGPPKEEKEETPSDESQNTPKILTGWNDGSRFPVLKLVRKDDSDPRNQRVEVWPFDETLPPWTTSAYQLRFLQPTSDERTVYLSDLTPADYQHRPFLDRRLPLGKDRNVENRPLRADGMLFLKGLGTASGSRIVYHLEEPFARFEANLAIDDSTDGRGSVLFRVLLDGKPVYTSPVVRGGQKPIPLSIDVTDAKQLELEVDYADRADQFDQTNWLDARLNRRISNKE